jgi:hypothetical protein
MNGWANVPAVNLSKVQELCENGTATNRIRRVLGSAATVGGFANIESSGECN